MHTDCSVRTRSPRRAAHIQTASIYIPLPPTGHTDSVSSAAVSVDGRTLLTASDDATARAWDLTTGACTAVLPHLSAPVSVALSRDTRTAVVVGANHVASLWDVPTATCTASLEGHTDVITAAMFDGSGFHVATSSRDCTVRYWNTITGEADVNDMKC